jgi:hypothetical protein
MAEMIKLGTKCNDCVFFEDDECKVYALEAFEEAGASITKENGNTVVDRVCAYKRDDNWSDLDKPYEDYDSLEKLIDEVYISGTIIVICKNDTSKLDEVLKKINGIKNSHKFKKVIVHLENVQRSSVLSVLEEYDADDYTVMQIFSESISDGQINLRSVADEAFKRAKNGYLYFIDSDKDFDDSVLDDLNSTVNIFMKRLLYVPPVDGEIHQMVCMAPLYKLLKGNKLDEIENKINIMAKSADCDNGIMTWEEVKTYAVN